MAKVSYLTYQDKYAGIKIAGTTTVNVPSGSDAQLHMHRAFYLTSQLEAPLWGTVQGYDGCGMSGGPMHWIALFPRTMEQGPLFSLLRRIEMTPGAPVQPLWDAFKAQGWYIAKDGKLRDLKNGSVISGQAIRATFTPPNGMVPKTGPQRQQAEKWAQLFYDLLSDDRTHEAQIDHSIEYLVRSALSTELEAYRLFIPDVQSPEKIDVHQLPEAVDLAMCVYHSFVPNAPAIAKSCLETVLDRVGDSPDPTHFAQALIRTLGTRQYGRWADVPGVRGSRYDSCRTTAIASKLWSPQLLNTLMPQDF
jgi:hypothetical protein